MRRRRRRRRGGGGSGERGRERQSKGATSPEKASNAFTSFFFLSLCSLTHQPDREPDGLEASSPLEHGDTGAWRGALDRERGSEPRGTSAHDTHIDVGDRRCSRRCHDSGAAAVGPPTARCREQACRAPLHRYTEAGARGRSARERAAAVHRLSFNFERACLSFKIERCVSPP